MIPLVHRFTGPMFVLLLIVSSHSPKAETPVLSGDTLEEELKWLRAELNVEITSLFKKPQRLFTSPAAVFVLTREEIRRSAATNIPDLLRLVPGMQVANVTSSLRAIASRGFNDRLTDKLLVLIDGRPVYRVTFSGVSWEVENYPLEDIERIEVIRGPGSTVWGANAVNGVINILTRDSTETVGGYLKGAVGTEQEVAGTLSYSFDLNENTSLRLFGNGSQYDSMALSQNAQGIDDWYFAQGGFRMDTDFGESRFSLQGQYADSDTGTLTDIIDPGFPPTFFRASDDDIQYSLGHLMGRYDHSFDEDHDLTFQLFYDYFDLRTENITRFRIHTVDTEFQHRSPLGDRQEVIFGLGYRYYPITSGSNAAPAFQITDAERHDQLFSFFVQDEIRVVEETLHLTVGTKVEYQDIIDSWEFMPQARLAWMPDETQTYWASISRAVRSPSFINVGIDGILPATPLGPNPLLPAPLNALNTFFRRDISVNKPKAEDVLGVELGVRIQPSEDTSLDFAAFYNEFDDLFALRLDLDPALVQVPTNPVPFISIPFVENNDMEGESYGFEIAGHWEVSDAWRMTGWYALQSDNTNATSTFISVPSEGSAPRHMVTVRSAFDILTDWEFDVIFRYADRVESTNASSYLTFDLRLGWRPSEDLSIVLIGRNLVEARHQEFGASAILSQQTSLVERAGILEIVYRF